MSSGYADLRHPLATKEGWAAFVSRAHPEPPRLLPESDLKRLDPVEREIYNEARQDYHSELLLVATPDIRQITTIGSKLIVNNRGKQLGRRGLIVSGASGTGKSTSITQLGKKHQIDLERRSPGVTGRIPVVYIIVPPAATPKTLSIQLATFLGLPVGTHDSQHAITQTVVGVLRKVGCSLILVDEIHRLDLRTLSGAEASDQLKYFFDCISATFVYAGLDLAENGMFSGMRGRQIAARFISLRTDRLETYSGISRQRLRTALPALQWGLPGIGSLPEDRPALYFYRPRPAARSACRPCAQHAAHDPTRVLVRPQASALVCRRHHRWLGTGHRPVRPVRHQRDPHRSPTLPAAPQPAHRPQVGNHQLPHRLVDHPGMGKAETFPAPRPPQAMASPGAGARTLTLASAAGGDLP